MSDQLVKVRFKLDAEDWHGHAGEKLWAAKINREEGLFELRNIPSFTRGISYRDVVKASPSEDPMQFDFECVVDRGGHSTYMLLVDPTEKRRGEYWKMLEKAGCSYESGQIELSIGVRLLFAVDVPTSSDLYEVYAILENGEKEGVWLFQEG